MKIFFIQGIKRRIHLLFLCSSERFYTSSVASKLGRFVVLLVEYSKEALITSKRKKKKNVCMQLGQVSVAF